MQQSARRTLEFFFDFGSPYSYLAHRAARGAARRRRHRPAAHPARRCSRPPATTVRRRSPPRAAGRRPTGALGQKYGAPFRHNPHFPINTLMLMRAAMGYQRRDEALFQRYVQAIFQAMWVDGRNLNDPAEIGAVLAQAGSTRARRWP